ncbi:unnamed protein product, partial [Prorocentrum cordatum]
MRAKLAELKKLAEDPVMEDSLKPQVEALQERVDQAQAKVETKVPRCFTECRVVRDRKRVVEQRDKCKGRVEELEAEVAKTQEKLQTERSNLERYEQKLDTLNKRISELSVPAPGKGWSAAVAFLEQAAKCLAEGPNQQEDPKLKEALAHALQQQSAEKERIAQAEERDSASQGGTKKRHLDTESKKEDLLEFEAGSSEDAIAKVLTTGGVTPEQAAKYAGSIKLLLDGLESGHTLTISKNFYTVNAKTVGSLERIMNDIYKVTPAPIILAQELQASQAKLDMFLANMTKRGWRIGYAPSAKTEGGWSAGVLIATTSSRGLDYARRGINTWDISPAGSKGRLAIAWLSAVRKQGVLCGSVYLWHSEGMTRRNELILQKWASVATATHHDWILGGDFNMEPAVLRASGLLGKMQGVIVHDQQKGTCERGDGTRSVCDYFVVSKSLIFGPMEARVKEGVNSSPHLPVALTVTKQTNEDRKIFALQKPQRWPLVLPTGCPGPPVAWPRPLVRHGRHAQSVMDAHWSELGVAYELHLNRYFNYDGEDLSSRQGHFNAAKYRWTFIEAQALKEVSKQQAWAEGAEWLAHKLRRIHKLVRLRWAGGKREVKDEAVRVSQSLLGHSIIMPLMQAQAERQEEGEEQQLVSESDAEAHAEDAGTSRVAAGAGRLGPPGPLPAPREQRPGGRPGPPRAGGSVSALAVCGHTPAQAPGPPPGPPEGQLLTWDTLRWPELVNTVGGLDVDAMDEKEMHYIDCIATLLDIASRRSWRAAQRASAASWRQWVRTHGQKGAGALHRWTKLPMPWQPQATAATTSTDDHELVHPQAAADSALAGWEAIWGDELDEQAPWMQAPSEVELAEYRPPPITPQQVIESCGRFRPKTGLGESEWHPRLWQHGGHQGAARVASVLNAVEAGAPWPTAQATILFYLLAKPAGGFRNLGLLPELARLWETIRMPYARQWEQAQRRAYDWAAKGRSSERAAWVQALFCEATVAQDLEYAVTYFDLVKCFVYVTHAMVWHAGLHWGFNRVVLKVVLRIYAMVRRIVLDGSYTVGRRWGRGIVAGSRFSPFCLKLVIFMELDKVVAAFPWADTCLFFDDLAVATKGLREFVRYWHPHLVQALIYMFEVTLDMVVSKGEQGKTVTLASTTPLQDELTKRIRPLGVRMAKEEKHLGVTTAAGRRRRVGASSKRALKFAARRDRIARVRRAGGPAAKIVRQAKVPSLLYGVQVMGMADTKLGELRQSVATSLQGNTKGRSTFLALLADDVDPGTLVNSAPILAWAQAWRETYRQPELIPELQAAWQKWALRVGRAKSPWQIVRGPAGAFVATVRRLGWMTQAAHSITIGAEVLDFRVAPLHALRHYVKGATEQGLKDAWLEKWGEKLGLQSVFVEPVRALLRRPLRGRWTQAHQARVRTLWCGGTWPQLRLFQKGAAENDTCQACQGARGTDRHRTFECPAREAHRREVKGHHIVQRGANPWPGTEQLWGRGLANDPAVEFGLWDLPSMDTLLVHGEFDGFVTGDVYTDGSLLYGSYAALRRGGWAFVQLTPDMQLRFACYGPQPGVACPPLTIWTDCQSILDGFARGPAWAERPSTMHSETWSRCWALIAENGGIGPRGIRFPKVKAHATRAQRQVMGLAQFAGNEYADQYAKL